jgi:hypothetical protein
MVVCRYDTISGLHSERSNEICFKFSFPLDSHQVGYGPSQVFEENCPQNPLLKIFLCIHTGSLLLHPCLVSRATLSYAFGKSTNGNSTMNTSILVFLLYGFCHILPSAHTDSFRKCQCRSGEQFSNIITQHWGLTLDLMLDQVNLGFISY